MPIHQDHIKEKPFKIANNTFTILPSYQKKKKKTQTE